MNLALFDFDGTITFKDSLIDFTRYAVGDFRWLLGMLYLSPVLLAMIIKILPNDRVKQRYMKHFFAKWTIEQFQSKADSYAKNGIPGIVRKGALERIEWHLNNGDKVVVVTASMENWLRKWCQKQGLDLIATEMESVNGNLTGRFAGKNCYGKEKVERIKQRLSLSSFEKIYAYGDSSGDLPMLSLADVTAYKPFR